MALAAAGIWCFIPLHCQQWATAMLERSKSADLVLELNFATISSTSPRGQFMKDVLDNHTSRIRELSLRGFSSSTLSTLLHDIRPSSFRLRSLQLIGGYNDAPSFPIDIVANSERLLDLDVEKCGIAWFSMPLTGLTSLKMDSNPTRPLWSEFIKALGAMPSLAILEMRHSLPLADELYRRTSNPIRLTKLRRLDLDCSAVVEILNLLSYIAVPQVTSIKIFSGTLLRNTSLPMLSDFAALLSAFISEMISEDSHPMFYEGLNAILPDSHNLSLLNFTAWRTGCKSDRTWRTSPPDLDFTIFGLPCSPEKLLHQFTKRLPLSRLKSLTLTGNACKDVLLACFGDLHQLLSVILIGVVTRGFLQMLMVDGKGRDQKSYYKVTCPALQSLKIRHVVFHLNHEDGLSFEELQDCLMERCNRNVGLSRVILAACVNLYDEDVDLLREIVVDVNWGEEYNPEDEDDAEMYSSD